MRKLVNPAFRVGLKKITDTLIPYFNDVIIQTRALKKTFRKEISIDYDKQCAKRIA